MSTFRLLGFIASVSLGGRGVGVGGVGCCGCHIKSDHQSSVSDTVAPAAQD